MTFYDACHPFGPDAPRCAECIAADSAETCLCSEAEHAAGECRHHPICPHLDARGNRVETHFEDDGNRIVRDVFAVEWASANEGLGGDYDPDDPDDMALLRFYTMIRESYGEWDEVDDGSVCTLFPVESTPQQRQDALQLLMDRLFPHLVRGESIKREVERLSYIEPDWVAKP